MTMAWNRPKQLRAVGDVGKVEPKSTTPAPAVPPAPAAGTPAGASAASPPPTTEHVQTNQKQHHPPDQTNTVDLGKLRVIVKDVKESIDKLFKVLQPGGADGSTTPDKP